jgi:hypothetical protein
VRVTVYWPFGLTRGYEQVFFDSEQYIFRMACILFVGSCELVGSETTIVCWLLCLYVASCRQEVRIFVVCVVCALLKINGRDNSCCCLESTPASLNRMACQSEDLHIRSNRWWELEVRHFVKTCFLVPT